MKPCEDFDCRDFRIVVGMGRYPSVIDLFIPHWLLAFHLVLCPYSMVVISDLESITAKWFVLVDLVLICFHCSLFAFSVPCSLAMLLTQTFLAM